MKQVFNSGDLVELKSGGPTAGMKVVGIASNGEKEPAYQCTWIDEDGICNLRNLFESCLKPYAVPENTDLVG